MKTTAKSASMEFSLTEILNGEYEGVWSGNIVKLILPSCIVFLTVTDAIRGIDVSCIITAKDGVLTITTE